MSNYTEADVERWHGNVLEMFEGRERESAGLLADLVRLKAAALEGAKVPGLVADNAALGSVLAHAESNCALRIQEWLWAPEVKEQMQALLDIIQPAADAWRASGAGRDFCAEVFDLRGKEYALRQTEAALRGEVSALQARVAEEEANHKRTMGELDASEEEVTALRARVAELERNQMESNRPWDKAGDFAALQGMVMTPTIDTNLRITSEVEDRFEIDACELAAVFTERDALRAQVTPMREALEWIERETHPEDGLTFERIHAKAAGALSAPPAETTPTSGDSPVLYVLELYRGEGEWDPMFLGTIASTVREKVDVKDRSMGSTRIAEYVRRTPAETTPAPEREPSMERDLQRLWDAGHPK